MNVNDQCWREWREFNHSEIRFPRAEGLLGMINHAATLYPQRPAVQGTDETLSYADLSREADRVAAFLRDAGVRRSSVVAVTASASARTYAGILGAFRAGCGYLPVDASHPADRLRFILRNAEAAALLARACDVPKLADAGPSSLARVVLDGPAVPGWHTLPAAEPAGDMRLSVAYVMYTSGTTGHPKGVRISHEALLNFVHWFAGRHNLRPEDRVAQVAPLTFDPSAQQIFPAWATGACVIPAPDAALYDPAVLLDWLAAERITHLDLVTSHWHQLREAATALDGECALPDLRWIIIGGESMYYHESREWFSAVNSPVRINNIYGPTEATINATEWEVERTRTEGLVPIGVPLPNYRLYVIRDGRLCARGETGELVIAGTGLADRYQSGEANSQAFDTFDLPDGTSERIYHSGDLARLISDRSGATVLEFRGRTDTQVKIRGYRVELDEVEAMIKTCPGISNAAVMVRGEPARQLVSFSTGAREVPPGQIRDHLLARAPGYMIPNLYLWLPEFPITRNGKVDRAALASALEAQLTARAGQGNDVTSTPEELAVSRAWARALDLPEVPADADFFDLGGTSLLAASAVSLLRRQGFRVQVRDLYQAPTARQFALRMTAKKEPDDNGAP